MTMRLQLVQTRPSLDVDFHTGSDEFKAVKSSMVDAGTLVDQGGSNDETGLKRTWILDFDTEGSLLTFESNVTVKLYGNARKAYNDSNGIIEVKTTAII
mgnify:FL=1